MYGGLISFGNGLIRFRNEKILIRKKNRVIRFRNEKRIFGGDFCWVIFLSLECISLRWKV